MLYQNIQRVIAGMTRKLVLSCDGSGHRSAVLFDGGMFTGGYVLKGSIPGYVPSLLWSYG